MKLTPKVPKSILYLFVFVFICNVAVTYIMINYLVWK